MRVFAGGIAGIGFLFAKENRVSNLEQTQQAISVDDIDVGGEPCPRAFIPDSQAD